MKKITPPGGNLGGTTPIICKALLIWGLAALFYFYDNLLQISPSAMKPELSRAFNIDAETFGSLSAYCLYAYGLMQIPAGLLMDKYGPRRLITLACVLCAVGSFLFGASTNLWEAKMARLLIGLGASFAWITGLRIAAVWFAPKRFALMTGAMVTIGFLGAVFGLGMLNETITHLGWRQTMFGGGIIGAVLTVALWLIVRDHSPIEEQPIFNKTHPKTLTLWEGLQEVINSKNTWIASLYAGLMFIPTLAFGGLWGIPFLSEANHIDRQTAGWLISLIYIGWIFGSPFFGWLSDYIGRRNPVMYMANIGTLVLTLIIIYVDNLSLFQMRAILFFLGFFSSGFIMAFAVVRENISIEASSTAIGFVNALNTLGGALAQPLIGYLLDKKANFEAELAGTIAVREFTLAHYREAFRAIPICLMVSLFILFFLKETYCKRIKT
ncbi:MAG: putative sulfoacetate transporter SauU [Francisellaceae bacterium]|nr:putative sulfoacetate transporter SauU [Francisellaceae bacterium]